MNCKLTGLACDDLGKLVLRLSLAFLLLFHGIGKILHPGMFHFVEQQVIGAHLPAWLAYGVFIGEILAPLMLLAGIYSRIAGLIVFTNMIFALYLVHAPQFLQLGDSGGWKLELQGFYLVCGLLVFLFGSGRFALKAD